MPRAIEGLDPQVALPEDLVAVSNAVRRAVVTALKRKASRATQDPPALHAGGPIPAHVHRGRAAAVGRSDGRPGLGVGVPVDRYSVAHVAVGEASLEEQLALRVVLGEIRLLPRADERVAVVQLLHAAGVIIGSGGEWSISLA